MSLPRGTTITTRVPLCLRLVCDSKVLQGFAEIADNAEMANSKRIALSDVVSEVTAFTEKLAGSDGHVVDRPIHLRVTQPSGPTVTLIDLPGIAQASELCANIYEETVGLVKKYIAHENLIILAVGVATLDLATVEAIRLAREVDPTGARTLGVLTKTDLCDQDSDIKEKLRGVDKRHTQLALGFIAVRNRTQSECDSGVTVEKARKEEAAFIQNSSLLSGLDRKYWGTDTLGDRIMELQSAQGESLQTNLMIKIATKR